MTHASSASLCLFIVLQQASSANLANVVVDADAFRNVRAQDNATEMPGFVERVVRLFGGRAKDDAGLKLFATKYSRADSQFEDMISEVAQQPEWAIWDEYAACVSDRGASAEVVGDGIAYACSNMKYFDCKNVPVQCTTAEGGVWNEADYIFSVYFNERSSTPYPTCYFGGAAIFQPSSIYRASPISCVATKNPMTTLFTDEGYQAIISQKNVSKTRAFITRLANSQSLGPILNENQLAEWSQNPPQEYQTLLTYLPALSPVVSFGALFSKPSWIPLIIFWIAPCLGLAQ